MAKLSARQIQTAKHPGDDQKGPILLSDGSGLNLQISPSGTKSWIFRFMIQGKARHMGLGTFSNGSDGVSLAEARQKAAEAKLMVLHGIDPIEARNAALIAQRSATIEKQAKAVTFAQAAQDYIAGQEAAWSNSKHRRQWPSTLATYAFPIIGDKPISEIDADDVEAVLKPIWLKVPETASRLRGRIEAVLDFAKAKGWRTGDNPARWKESLKHRLPPISKVRTVRHHPALPWKRVPEFLEALRSHSGISARALEFVILTACRSGEARGARWSEIDLANRVWTIPASRMKSGKEHRVPLSSSAVAILEAMMPLHRGPQSLVFPSPRASSPLSDMTLSKLVRGMNAVKSGQKPLWVSDKGESIVVHGFRSTFRDWVEEATSTPHSVAEAALAHSIKDKVESAYRRTDLFEKRRSLMAEWSEYCCSRTEMH